MIPLLPASSATSRFMPWGEHFYNYNSHQTSLCVCDHEQAENKASTDNFPAYCQEFSLTCGILFSTVTVKPLRALQWLMTYCMQHFCNFNACTFCSLACMQLVKISLLFMKQRFDTLRCSTAMLWRKDKICKHETCVIGFNIIA